MKSYWLQFGAGNPASFTGLTPTLITFSANGLTAISAPAIAETPSGSGLYKFSYGPTLPIIFVADGGATLAASSRYLSGVLDPVQAVDESIGTVSDSIGSTSVDPSTLFGYVKRSLEFWEGNSIYTKLTGVWQIFSRGSSQLIRTKTLTNTSTTATKT